MAGGFRCRALLVVLIAGVGVLAGPAAEADEWTLQAGIHADVWSGSGQDGHQILAPFTLGYNAPDWGVSMRGAFGNSERDPGGGTPSGSITGFTDSTLAGYYRLTVAQTELQLALGLDLPTGVSRLTNRQLAAIQDEDLAALERLGEGLDVNPTVIAYRSFGGFGLGLGLGYLYTGKYDPTKDVPGDDFDRGDELTVAALGDVYVADLVRLLGRVGYTYFTSDERGGVETFKEGDELDMRLSAEWRPEPWWLVVTLRDIYRFKAERPNASGRLVTEARNSHGNDFRASMTFGYSLTDAWSVEGTAAVRYVSANDYPSGDPLRDDGRTKYAFGPSVSWSPTRTFGIDAGIAYFILDVGKGPSFARDSTFRGIHADLRVTYRF